MNNAHRALTGVGTGLVVDPHLSEASVDCD